MLFRLSILVLLVVVADTAAQTWCNKHYMSTQPVVPPGGQFPVPPRSTSPQLSLRCAQAIRPYLAEDAHAAKSADVSILIDTPVRFLQLPGATPISLSSTTQTLSVTVKVDGATIASGGVPLNATKHALPLNLSKLKPRARPFVLTCTASLGAQTFSASGALSYLPDPPSAIGSVTKMDLRTGALLARPADGSSGPFAPVFPIGFYTAFDSYLAKNLSVINELKEQGFTVIHPIPDFNNQTSLNAVLDRMQEVDMYLMYDFRNTYRNTTSVTAQVNNIKSRRNLLLWYTADEPDGTSDALSATSNAYSLIASLDGGPPVSAANAPSPPGVPALPAAGGIGYHPISLVLNCENYEFSAYTAGSDIVMQDTYMIGNNVTFSTQWNTPCTPDFGDCGCDNCHGSFEDISTRMDEFAERLFINGWDRTKAVWAVPQGFGNETYWKRYPTGKEFNIQSVLGINHGATGVVSWDDPTTPDIKASASTLAKALPSMVPFIFNPSATFARTTFGRVDIGVWLLNKAGFTAADLDDSGNSGDTAVPSQALILTTNLNNDQATIQITALPLLGIAADGTFSLQQIWDSGAQSTDDSSGLLWDALGSGAWIVTFKDR
ncbi:hypothetical protein HGRIS_006885 [Hohenbuehelia grisea]|uniref:Uncharacterized protein n=1 Tax=Hohenbuehelia grisea TaxID=104357 RepID=A0ABR3JAD9_9AGAR